MARVHMTEYALIDEATTAAADLAAEQITSETLGGSTNSWKANEIRTAGKATVDILVEAMKEELPEDFDWSKVVDNIHQAATSEEEELTSAA